MKMDFEESKYITWFGVVSYFGLQGVIWGWKRWVERGEVFNGKRRRMVKRVSPSLSSSSQQAGPCSFILSFLHAKISSRNEEI